MRQEEILTKIECLNLSPILFLLVKRTDGPNFTFEGAKIAEKWYKRFLFLKIRYPEKAIVPTRDIDEVWHAHLLDTKKYSDDCQALFGEFLHHFPYVGLRGQHDAAELDRAFLETLQLFRIHFGETPLDECGAAAAPTVCSGHILADSYDLDLTTRPQIDMKTPSMMTESKE